MSVASAAGASVFGPTGSSVWEGASGGSERALMAAVLNMYLYVDGRDDGL